MPADGQQTMSADFSALPIPPCRLIGREAEVRAIGTQLLAADIRLLTLTGPAGVGKTRLALEVGAAVRVQFAAGAVFADLAPIADPALVLSQIAEAVGVQPSPSQPLIAVLSAVLRDQQLLLIIDNCEHLLAAGPELASLLARCPSLTVLATSRTPLRLRGEQERPVAPLNDKGGVHLFMDRARAVQPDLLFDHAARQAVQDICRRLDGLPLAIELAAARCRVLNPTDLLARLRDGQTLLTGGEFDRPVHHRSLRAALTWSHELLSDQEKTLFRRLAVIVGGFSLQAAESVCGWDELNVLDSLDSLVRWNLVGRDGGRFRMLQTIRDFALEQLGIADDAEHARERHARHCLQLAECASAGLSGPQERDERQRLQAEQDEVRAALAWTVAAGRVELGLQLASTMAPFWVTGGQLEEGRTWLHRLLANPDTAPAPIRARALCATGVIATWQDDRVEARAVLDEALAMARSSGDLRGAAEALSALELLACRAHDDAASVGLAQEALDLRYRGEDKAALASALSTLGRATASAGGATRASILYQESLAIRRRLGDTFGTAEVLSYIGRDALRGGQFASARVACKEALAMFRELGARMQVAWALLLLGGAARGLRDTGAATSAYREALEVCMNMSAPLWVAVALAGLGGAALDDRRPEHAARLLSAAEKLRATVGVFPQIWDTTLFERDLSLARSLLGDRATRAWEAGQVMSLKEMVQLALSATRSADEAQGECSPLTRREREVARLVAHGLTNRQIAERLVISTRTAGNHVEHILARLRLTSRTQIAAWIIEKEGLTHSAHGPSAVVTAPIDQVPLRHSREIANHP